jgi:hypothetical protein
MVPTTDLYLTRSRIRNTLQIERGLGADLIALCEDHRFWQTWGYRSAPLRPVVVRQDKVAERLSKARREPGDLIHLSPYKERSADDMPFQKAQSRILSRPPSLVHLEQLAGIVQERARYQQIMVECGIYSDYGTADLRDLYGVAEQPAAIRMVKRLRRYCLLELLTPFPRENAMQKL